MAPTLQPNVRYRIQNVDFGTFLERRNRNELLMRPMKETLQQQWFFSEKPADGTFQILNAEERGYLLDALASFNVAIGRARNAQGPQWELAYGPSRELYIVSADVGSDNVLLSCDSISGALTLEQDSSNRNIRNISKEDNYQWRILEDSPATLPATDGKYRIRTLNGYTIHSEPDMTTLSIANQERGNHRAWEIISLGNGICTIKNVQEDAFLATALIDSEWAPVLSKNLPAPEWEIASLGNMTYSIVVRRVIDNTGELRRLSLTLKDDTIILKPMKSVHNQLWYIEATDAPLDSTSTAVPTGIPIGQSAGAPKVLIGLVEAEYFLCSDGGHYIYVNPSDQNVLVDLGQKSLFKVKLVEDVGGIPGVAKVCFIHSETNRYLAYSALGGNGYILVLANRPLAAWRLTPVSAGNFLRFTIIQDNSPEYGLSTENSNTRPIYSSDQGRGSYRIWELLPKTA
ncbi:hypothetical protein GALMADRAFT_925296 [Galerina marginata CBS 339.88]|uniref:Uncharacterized protein n=1 Tax=Galerina marginata (strain CBS 339.88) TaxID=685588 RepID=A0A067SNE0_GALM3|nr:hypothetical protein GALMADRAFT_925296 [Galerina marginata CBS 339.88]